jgi:hypothetical protein
MAVVNCVLYTTRLSRQRRDYTYPGGEKYWYGYILTQRFIAIGHLRLYEINPLMMKNILFLILCLPVFYLFSCNKEAEQKNIKIQTDKTNYSVSENINVEYTVLEYDSLWVFHCNYVIDSYIQKKEGNEWVNHASKLCLAIYISGLMVLSPRYTFSETAVIEEKGTYRVALNYSLVPDAAETQVAFSNSFDVR